MFSDMFSHQKLNKISIYPYYSYIIVLTASLWFIEAKEAERLDIEEKYNSLQEEAVGKTKKLKKVWNMLNATKSEIEDLHHVSTSRAVYENLICFIRPWVCLLQPSTIIVW